jgi:hypothetical protein
MCKTTSETQDFFSGRDIRSHEVGVAFEPEESGRDGEVHLAYIPGRTGDAQFHETEL